MCVTKATAPATATQDTMEAIVPTHVLSPVLIVYVLQWMDHVSVLKGIMENVVNTHAWIVAKTA